jgi:predicted kinase
MANAQLHLIAGSTGAGKTTYAMALAERTAGLRFSIDEWMTGLFGPDAPQPMDPGWMWERVARCEVQILDVARAAAASGIPVILDLGFQQAAKRRTVADELAQAGFEVVLHWLDVDTQERWRRVSARNEQPGATYRLTVTRQMFDYIEAFWEPPTDEEMARMNGVRGH